MIVRPVYRLVVKTPGRVTAFSRELRRRRVIGTVIAYAIAAAGVMQVADVVAPRMNLPDSTVTIVIFIALLGLPIAAVLAWFYHVEPEAPSAPAVPVPVERSHRSVAVLPFINLSPDPENEYFADGITEDVISHLSKISQLSVISRRSVMEFKKREQPLREIGAALGAGALLDGSVRHAGDRVRVVAQLVDANTARNLWSETYDRKLTDVFLIQTDVALHIAGALQAQLSPAEKTRVGKQPTTNLPAYQLYLQARQQHTRYTKDTILEAVEYYQRAIAIDPQYAIAFSGMAIAYAELGETGGMEPGVAYQRARAAGEAALRIDPDHSDAHSVLAQLAMYEFDWERAEAGFKRAVALSPSNASAWDLYGRMCSSLARHDEAIEMQRRAHVLDPMVPHSDLANALLRGGRYEEAERTAVEAVRAAPDYDRAHATLAWAYLLTKRPAEGIAELEKAVALTPDNTGWWAQLGQAYALNGDPQKAHDILARLTEKSAHSYVSPYHFAYVYTGLGEYDKAMDYLETAYRERAGAIYGIKGSFLFTDLKSHPRFVALLEKMNLA